MKKLIRHNLAFYLLYLIFLLAGAVLIHQTEQLSLHRYFNSWVGNSFLNETFKLLTYFGDGMFTLFVIEVLLFINVKKSLFILSAYSLSGLIVQVLKYGVFDEVNRPYFYHSYEGLSLNIVQGVDMHIHNSFPSGHSTAAFSLFLCLSLLIKNKAAKCICFVGGLCVAFSRVYLSQHFFEDIYAGSLIAIVVASLMYYFFYISAFNSKLEKLNKPVWKLFKNEKNKF